MATDHTRFKSVDADGKVNFTSEVTFLRLFVKENVVAGRRGRLRSDHTGEVSANSVN